MRLSRCLLAHGDHDDGRCSWCGIALTARRRRWCSEACSRAWSENHFWSAARAAALRRNDGRCEICGDPEEPEVHHDPPVGDRGYSAGCQHHQDRLAVLCPTHHRAAHAGMRLGPGETLQPALFG
jgi:hypothetical protein